MKTLYSQILPIKALASATVQTGATNGIAIDTGAFGNNFRDIVFTALSGALTDGTYTFTVEESDASGSGYAAVDAGRVQGTLPVYAATDDNVVKFFGVRPTKRYVRVVVTAAGATTGGVLAVQALCGSSGNNPPAQA